MPCNPGNYNPFGKLPTLRINAAFLTLIAYVGVPFINTSGAHTMFQMKAQHQLHRQLCCPDGNALPSTSVVASDTFMIIYGHLPLLLHR